VKTKTYFFLLKLNGLVGVQSHGFEVRKEEKLICGLQRKKWPETVLHS
jgi:hypothetical protein